MSKYYIARDRDKELFIYKKKPQKFEGEGMTGKG